MKIVHTQYTSVYTLLALKFEFQLWILAIGIKSGKKCVFVVIVILLILSC